MAPSTAKWQIPAEVRRRIAVRTCIRRTAAATRLEHIVDRTGRLLPKDYWPDLQFLSNWMGGTMRAYLRGFPEFFGDKPVRDVGLIASEGRMTIPVEDGTPAGILDIRHHYFEFIPEDQGDRDEPETVEAADLDRGQELLHRADDRRAACTAITSHDLVHCVGFHGRAPLIEFLNKGSHFSSLTGEKLSEHQVIAAVEAAQQKVGLQLQVVPAFCLAGVNPRFTRCSSRQTIWPATKPPSSSPGPLMNELRSQNIEYANRRDTLRLGPVRTIRLAEGSWLEFQKRRLAPERRNRRTV